MFFEERFQSIGGYVEPGFYNAFASSVFDCLDICTLTDQQSDGSQDNGLTCTRFTGDDRKTGMKVDIQRFYQRIVLYMNGL